MLEILSNAGAALPGRPRHGIGKVQVAFQAAHGLNMGAYTILRSLTGDSGSPMRMAGLDLSSRTFNSASYILRAGPQTWNANNSVVFAKVSESRKA